MGEAIELHSLVGVTGNQVSCQVGSERVILSLKTEQYYGLNPVASRVWELMAEPRPVEDICRIIQHEYEVDAERCRQDVLELLSELLSDQLIEIKRQSSEST